MRTNDYRIDVRFNKSEWPPRGQDFNITLNNVVCRDGDAHRMFRLIAQKVIAGDYVLLGPNGPEAGHGVLVEVAALRAEIDALKADTKGTGE